MGADTMGHVADGGAGQRPRVRQLKREGSDVWSHHALASAPWTDGEMAVVADFFFTPDGGKLAFVKMQPNDVKQCMDWADTLTARYGKGIVETSDYPEIGLSLYALRWTDAKTKERLTCSRRVKAGEGATYCHFVQRAPA